jgi:DNA-binding HxlR family transcriptional regulator
MIQPICPKFDQATRILGRPWVGLIVHQLLQGPHRFNQLEHEIRISGRVLSMRLKELEADQIVSRKVYPETPVRIEYELTEKGRSLQPVIESIFGWSQTWVK